MNQRTGTGNLMTYAAQIISDSLVCHGPEGGVWYQPLVGGLFWSALTCQRFGSRRPVAAVQSSNQTAATGRRLPKRRQAGALQNARVKLTQVDQAALQRSRGGLRAISHAELAENVIDVTLNRRFADAQARAYFLVALPLDN